MQTSTKMYGEAVALHGFVTIYHCVSDRLHSKNTTCSLKADLPIPPLFLISSKAMAPPLSRRVFLTVSH